MLFSLFLIIILILIFDLFIFDRIEFNFIICILFNFNPIILFVILVILFDMFIINYFIIIQYIDFIILINLEFFSINIDHCFMVFIKEIFKLNYFIKIINL